MSFSLNLNSRTVSTNQQSAGLCDVFDDELKRIAKEVGSRAALVRRGRSATHENSGEKHCGVY